MTESNDISAQLRDVFTKLMIDKQLAATRISVADFDDNGVKNANLISQVTMAEALKNAAIEAGFPEKYADFRVTHRVYLNADSKGGVAAELNPEIYKYISGEKAPEDTPVWGNLEDKTQYLSGAPQMSANDDPDEILSKQVKFENSQRGRR